MKTAYTQRDCNSTNLRRSGFTLIEVVLASAISLLLFLVLFEALMVSQRMAANLKWRLAADSIAFDKAWEVFNWQLKKFETDVTEDQASWTDVSLDQTSVFISNSTMRAAQVMLIIKLNGSPVSNWVIQTSVRWPLPGSGSGQLPKYYELTRTRNDRNLFRATK